MLKHLPRVAKPAKKNNWMTKTTLKKSGDFEKLMWIVHSYRL